MVLNLIANLWPLVMMIKHVTFVILILVFLLDFCIIWGLKQEDKAFVVSQVEIYIYMYAHTMRFYFPMCDGSSWDLNRFSCRYKFSAPTHYKFVTPCSLHLDFLIHEM
jgi:hypothetical protein